MITKRCGCTIDLDPDLKVLKAIDKCAHHKSMMTEVSQYGQEYYEKCGSLKDGVVQSANYLSEIKEALGEFPIPAVAVPEVYQCLEVGGGVSPYCKHIQDLGYQYFGIESSKWACRFMQESHGVTMLDSEFENTAPSTKFNLVLAVHVLEHTQNPLTFLQHLYEMTAVDGELFLIVPDDSDLCNPDHLWFFDVNSLFNLIRMAGFDVLRLVIRKPVEHENFLYVRAIK